MLWVSQIPHLLLGSWTCSAMVPLLPTQTSRSQEWTSQCQHQSEMMRVVYSRMRMVWRSMRTVMDSTRPFTKKEQIRRSIGARLRKKSRSQRMRKTVKKSILKTSMSQKMTRLKRRKMIFKSLRTYILTWLRLSKSQAMRTSNLASAALSAVSKQ